MRTNDEGVKLIKKWEGCKLKAYQDVAGIWTIGYGHTSAAGGLKVTPGLVISEKQAEEILKGDLVKFENDVNKLVKVPLTDNQFATLVSFHFNTGALGKSTLLKRLNKGEYEAVPSELMKWVNAGGKKVQGLINRRKDEGALWNSQFATEKPKEELPKVEAPVTKEKAPSFSTPSGVGSKTPSFWVSLLMLIWKELRK